MYGLSQALPGWSKSDIESLEYAQAVGVIDAASGKNVEGSGDIQPNEMKGWDDLRLESANMGMYKPTKNKN